MPKGSVAHAVDVVDQYRNATDAVRSTLVNFTSASWVELGSWRDPDVAGYIDSMVPMVRGAQYQTAALYDAFLAEYETALTGALVRPVGVPTRILTGLRSGTDLATVYRRPAVDTYRALSKGLDLVTAVDRGRQRVESLASTDMQLAKRASAQYVLERKDTVVGYSRVLEGAQSCGLCIVASTQRYHRSDLLPIHPGCSCDVAPIYGSGGDPGRVIDRDLYDETTAALAERFGPDSTDPATMRSQLIVREHGELGPLLSVRGQQFTGPDDVD